MPILYRWLYKKEQQMHRVKLKIILRKGSTFQKAILNLVSRILWGK